MWTRNPRLAAAKLLFIYQCTNFLGIFFHLNACNRPFYAISQYRRVARQAVSTQLLRRSILYLYVCHGVSLCMQTRTDEKAYRHFSNKYKYAINERSHRAWIRVCAVLYSNKARFARQDVLFHRPKRAVSQSDTICFAIY